MARERKLTIKPNERKTLDFKYRLEKAVEDEGIAPPLEYLVAIMAGRDPRPVRGHILELVGLAVEEGKKDGTGLPSVATWELLVVALRADPRLDGEYVPLADGAQASRELLSYLQPKLKAVQVSGDMAHLVKVQPLTPEEAKRFEAELFEDFG